MIDPVNLDLFAFAERQRKQRVELPPPFVHGSETSRRAAIAMRSRAETVRDRVFAVIASQARYGSTDSEGCERSGINPSTWRPRRGELEKLGLIRDTGRTRKSSSGRDMVVWAAAGVADVSGT